MQSQTDSDTTNQGRPIAPRPPMTRSEKWAIAIVVIVVMILLGAIRAKTGH